jgi:hypothetical protein
MKASSGAGDNVENAVLGNPGTGRTLDLLPMIDAGLGHRQAVMEEALRARNK